MLRTTKGVILLLSLSGLLFQYANIATKLEDAPKPIDEKQQSTLLTTYLSINKLTVKSNFSSSAQTEEAELRPTLTCPLDISGLQCGEALPIPLSTIEEFLENGGHYEEFCEGDFRLSASEFDSNLDYCSEVFSLVRRRYTLTDACGYSKSCIQRFIYDTDNAAPEVDCSVISDLFVGCEDFDMEEQIQVWIRETKTALLAASTDNCGVTTADHNYLGNAEADLGCESEAGIMITFHVSDACGQQTSCNASIVPAPPRPEIGQLHDEDGLACGTSLPEPITTIEDYIAIGGAITDYCGKGLTLTHQDIGDVASMDFCSERSIMIRRRYTVTDGCGNSRSTIQRFEFTRDTEAPQIDCGTMNDLTIDCDKSLLEGDIQEWISTMQNKIMNSATDNCSSISVEHNYTAGSAADMECSGGEELRVSFSVSDECGNISSCHAAITSSLPSVPRPEIICVDDVADIACGGELPAAASTTEEFAAAGGEIIDYCDGEITIRSEEIGSVDDVDVCSNTSNLMRRRYIINDNCGNERRCIQRLIFRQDVDAPTVDCDLTNDLIINCDAEVEEEDIADWLRSVTDDLDAASSDDCSDVSIQNDYLEDAAQNLNCDDNKELIVTFLISDECGNTTSCSASIMKEDTGQSGLVLGNRIASIKTIKLLQNSPNPFEESTAIRFDLKKAGKVRLTVYDMSGKLLFENTKEHNEGLNTINVSRDMLNNTTGVVFYSIEAGGFKEVKTMIVLE